MATVESITKQTQDYTNLGYTSINTYTKFFTTEDGRSAGKIQWYTFQMVNGTESKKYFNRGNAVNGMFKKK